VIDALALSEDKSVPLTISSHAVLEKEMNVSMSIQLVFVTLDARLYTCYIDSHLIIGF
jgi:hypothetical protein